MVIKGSAEIAGVSSINCFKKSDSVKKNMILIALVMVFGITSLVHSSDKQDQSSYSDDQKMSLQGLSDRALKHLQNVKSLQAELSLGKLGHGQLDQVIDEHGQLIESALKADNTEESYDFIVNLASVQASLPVCIEGCSKESFQNYIEKFVGWHEWLIQITVLQFVRLDTHKACRLAMLVAGAESSLLVKIINQPKAVYKSSVGKLIKLHEQWVQEVMPLFARADIDEAYELVVMVADVQHSISPLGVLLPDHVKKMIELHKRLGKAIVPLLAGLSVDQAENWVIKMTQGWLALLLCCTLPKVTLQNHFGKLIEVSEQLVQAIMSLFVRANTLKKWQLLMRVSQMQDMLVGNLSKSAEGVSSGCIEKLVKIQEWVYCQEEDLVKTQEWVHHQDAMKLESSSDGEVEKAIVMMSCQLALLLSKQSEGVCRDHVEKMIGLQEQAKLMIKRLSDRRLIGDEMRNKLNTLLSELSANVDLCKKKSKNEEYVFFLSSLVDYIFLRK
jgi:hypothetical protein